MFKGNNTTTTNQAQTYTPDPQAASAIQGALGNAQTVAQNPFQTPVAPVAGFSPDQLAAFQTINNAQGMASPYFTQASNLFNQSAQTPNINQFFNPLAGAVGAQMQNLFGQQMSQATGQLTQAAGGVGASRIATGQSELANQQALAEGQTMAGLYAPALQAAQQQQNILQGAAYGQAALGPAAQNSVLAAANAQLGTGGLQQQLSQAQLNAPYQNTLARLAYPFQTANFLSGQVGALAPGLGGTTWGGGQTTGPSPSVLSQILGLGTAGIGAFGAFGGFGGGGQGGSAFNPLSGLNASDYQGYGIGGNQVAPGQYVQSRGGAVGYAEGGAAEDEAPSDKPVNLKNASIVPDTKLAPMPAHIPTINTNPPSPNSGSGKGSGIGNIIGDVAKVGALFANRGGTVGMGNPAFLEGYADGSAVDNNPFDDDLRQIGEMKMRHGWGTPMWSEPDKTRGLAPASPPLPRERPSDAPVADTGDMPVFNQRGQMMGNMMSYQGQPSTANNADDQAAAFAGPSVSQNAPRIQRVADASPQSSPLTNPSQALAYQSARDDQSSQLAQNPWMALMAAGLGTAAGTSPFAMTNIGQGGLMGLKALQEQQAAAMKQEQLDRAERQMEQERKFHERSLDLNERKEQFLEHIPHEVGRNKWGQPVRGMYDPIHGTWTDTTGKPIDWKQIGEMNEGELEPMAQAMANYTMAPLSPYKIATPVGAQLAARIMQINPQWDQKFYGEAQKTRNDFASGVEARTVRSMSVAASHVEVAKGLVNAMNTGNNQIINHWKNQFETIFGKNTAPANAEAANQILGDEIMKAVIGSRSALGDREQVAAQLNVDRSKGILMSQYEKVYKPMMMGQLEGLERQYTAGTHGAKDFGEKLSPEVARDLEAFKQASRGAAAPAAPPGAGSAAAKPTLQEFLVKAKQRNPNASDAELTAFYNHKYGG